MTNKCIEFFKNKLIAYLHVLTDILAFLMPDALPGHDAVMANAGRRDLWFPKAVTPEGTRAVDKL